MQNSPSQVKIWTQASLRMVDGISRMTGHDLGHVGGDPGLLALHALECRHVLWRVFLGGEDGPQDGAEEGHGAQIERVPDRRGDSVLAAAGGTDAEPVRHHPRQGGGDYRT